MARGWGALWGIGSRDANLNKVEAGEVSTIVLSEDLPVVQEKLVKRIVKDKFIDMAELLKGKMAAERHHAAFEGESSQAPLE